LEYTNKSLSGLFVNLLREILHSACEAAKNLQRVCVKWLKAINGHARCSAHVQSPSEVILTSVKSTQSPSWSHSIEQTRRLIMGCKVTMICVSANSSAQATNPPERGTFVFAQRSGRIHKRAEGTESLRAGKDLAPCGAARGATQRHPSRSTPRAHPLAGQCSIVFVWPLILARSCESRSA
jgi:hypothetical protein